MASTPRGAGVIGRGHCTCAGGIPGLPAPGTDNVSVAVTVALSTSLMTMSVRFSGVCLRWRELSAALRLVACGASLVVATLVLRVAVLLPAKPSLTANETVRVSMLGASLVLTQVTLRNAAW